MSKIEVEGEDSEALDLSVHRTVVVEAAESRAIGAPGPEVPGLSVPRTVVTRTSGTEPAATVDDREKLAFAEDMEDLMAIVAYLRTL